jgi:hypothetical protein
MTTQTLDERKAINRAWLDGKQVQFASKGGDVFRDFEGERPDFWSDYLVWRIAPTPRLRPWKPYEIPVGGLIKDSTVDFTANPVGLILAARGAWVHFFDPETAKIVEHTTESMLKMEKFTYSTDNGATWKPCGVETCE